MTGRGIPRFGRAPIPLDRAALAGLHRADILHRIGRIVRSVRFELMDEDCAFRILGPNMSYHDADPFLAEGLQAIERGMTADGIGSYWAHRGRLDLCLEDSWSGRFIADTLADMAPDEDLILIHLDDHTDMMPTLLEQVGGHLVDPVSGRVFDPISKVSWEDSIYTGCVSIGNFITPLFYGGRKIHVRHLNNVAASALQLFSVIPASARYDIVPEKAFATIAKSASNGAASAGTYRCGDSPARVLDALPAGRVIVHIDLDYFINDFNGNIGQDPAAEPETLRGEAARKLDAVFETLGPLKPTIARWVVATSPGFCSGQHWAWLIEEIDRRVSQMVD